jgi:hypothetical protein
MQGLPSAPNTLRRIKIVKVTLTIQLTEEQAAAVQSKAAALGPSLEEWLQKLAI